MPDCRRRVRPSEELTRLRRENDKLFNDKQDAISAETRLNAELTRLREEIERMASESSERNHGASARDELATIRTAFDDAREHIDEVRKAMTDSAPFMTRAGVELLTKLEAFLSAHPATETKGGKP